MAVQEKFLVAVFDKVDPLLSAVRALRHKSVPIHDVYTPFPVHGLDEELGLKRTNLHIIGFVFGAIGFLFALCFMAWVLCSDWSITYGGKPFLSIPSFIPIAFELMVLCAVLSMGLTFLYWSKMAPGIKKHHFHHGITNDKLVIVLPLDKENSVENQRLAEEVFQNHIPVELREQFACTDWQWGLYGNELGENKDNK